MVDRQHFDFCINRILEEIEDLKNSINNSSRPKKIFDGEEMMDNQDLCEFLGVTKRTLQRYRQKKLITYYTIDGKSYYKKSEIQTFFKTFQKKD